VETTCDVTAKQQRAHTPLSVCMLQHDMHLSAVSDLLVDLLNDVVCWFYWSGPRRWYLASSVQVTARHGRRRFSDRMYRCAIYSLWHFALTSSQHIDHATRRHGSRHVSRRFSTQMVQKNCYYSYSRFTDFFWIQANIQQIRLIGNTVFRNRRLGPTV